MPERPRNRGVLLLAIACIALAYSVLLLDDPRPAYDPNGVIQNAGALAFLSASVCFGAAFAYGRRLPHLLLAVLFLFGAGEEASWGQHAFGFGPPEAVAERNAQDELTVHNLNVIQQVSEAVGFDILLAGFVAFTLAYTLGLALLVARSPRARAVLEPWLLPPPVSLGLLAFANLALFGLAGLLSPAEHSHAVSEVAETGFAVIFLAVAFDAVRRSRTLARALSDGSRGTA